MLRDAPRDSTPRELKIPLPVSLHLKLHVIKVQEGRLIGDVVTTALQRYFEKRAR